MRNVIGAVLFLFSSVALADLLLDEILNLDSGKEKLVKIQTKVPVSINIELITDNIGKAMECKSCLHLSHKLLDGYIPQKNSSSIGVGFIKVLPEQGEVQVIVSHNHPSMQKIRIIVQPSN